MMIKQSIVRGEGNRELISGSIVDCEKFERTEKRYVGISCVVLEDRLRGVKGTMEIGFLRQEENRVFIHAHNR